MSLLPVSYHQFSNGRRLRVSRCGAGPPLVLLHGYPETLQIFSRLVPLLANRFEVLAFDWPGMGYSDEWPGGATPELKARQLLAILDELRIQRPVIAGLDMGGQPALAFAAMYPQRLRQLVVMNSLVFGDEPTSWEIRLLRRFGFNRFALRKLPRLIFYRAERTFLPAGQRLSGELRQDFWRSFRSPAVRRFISKMCAGYQGTLPGLPQLYQQIRCPVLVLWGGRDKHFPVRQAERLSQTIPQAQLQIVADGWHWMPLTDADTIAAAIFASEQDLSASDS